MFTYRLPASRSATSVAVIPVHTACTGLCGLPRSKARAPAAAGAPGWRRSTVGSTTSCVQMSESDEEVLLNCAKQPPRSVLACGGTSWSPLSWKTKSDVGGVDKRFENVHVTVSPD